MKKVILGLVLLIGLSAASHAQAKSNKEVAVQLVHNNFDGYYFKSSLWMAVFTTTCRSMSTVLARLYMFANMLQLF